MARYSGRGMQDTNGWQPGRPSRHFCYPPKSYPDTDHGQGCLWICPRTDCRQQWQAFGTQVLKWPEGFSRNDSVLGPEYWVAYGRSELKSHDGLAIEQLMYDFRNPLDLILEELRHR